MKNSFNYTLTLCALFLCQGIMAQATYEGNDNGGPPGSFLGWDNSVLFPLEVRHDAYFPILFSTNNTIRMRVAPWGNVFVGYSGFTNPTAKLQVGLTNLEAATGSNFESTAIRADNRFGSEGDIINRGVRSASHAPNIGAAPFNGYNYAGTFWARDAFENIGVLGVAAPFENGIEPSNNTVGINGYGVMAIARDHEGSNIALAARADASTAAPNAWTVGVLAAAGGSNAYSGWFDGNIMYNG